MALRQFSLEGLGLGFLNKQDDEERPSDHITKVTTTNQLFLREARRKGVDVLFLCDHGEGRRLRAATDMAEFVFKDKFTQSTDHQFGYGSLGNVAELNRFKPDIAEKLLTEISQFPLVVLTIDSGELGNYMKTHLESLKAKMGSRLIDIGSTDKSYSDILKAIRQLEKVE